MTLLLALVVFPLLFLLPGYISARALFRDPDGLSAGDKLFIPIAASILISTWFGFVLAELGRFSLPALVTSVLIYSALLWLVRRKQLAPWSWRGIRFDWFFLAILALALLLAIHPAEYILGGNDASVYVNTGINIARTGAIAIHDPTIQALPVDPGHQFFLDLVNPFMLF